MSQYTISLWNLNDPIPDSGILLIRHGPRHGGSFPSHNVLLTNEGRDDCLMFGRRWDSIIPTKIYSSQVQRCVDTGELISIGAKWGVQVEKCPLLGDLGPFVIDQQKLHEMVEIEHDWGFLKRHINGENVPGMRDRDKGCEMLITELSSTVDESDFILAVSHDSIIAAVLAYGGRNPDPWPQPLCGASLMTM